MNALTLPLPEIANRIRHALHKNVVEIGDLLLQAKSQLDHGDFQKWTARELGIKPRSAQNYMQAAEFVKGKSETVAHLPPTILYQLAAPNAPQNIVAKVVTAETIDIAEVELELDQHRQAKVLERRKKPTKKTQAELNREQRRNREAERLQALVAKEEAERAEKLRPLIERITAAGLSVEIADVVKDWAMCRTFERLLVEAAQ